MIVKNIEKKEKNTITFQVEVNAEAFEEAVQSSFLKNRKKVSVPGFRKGKAPRMIIQGMYGADVFYDDAIELISPKAFSFAEESEKFETVGQPQVTDVDVNDEKVLLLSFESALYPEVTLGQYKGLEVPKPEVEITDADVDKYLEEMQTRNARQVAVERAAKLGDNCDINFEGFIDGVAFEGGKADGHKLVLGSGTFIPGFEEQVVGLSTGEEKDIPVTFPEAYQSAGLAGKAVIFKVKINEIIETELPAIDDEFAKDVSESDNLADYKVAIKDELTATRNKAVESEFNTVAIEMAADNMICEVPDAMIDERMGEIIQEYDRNLMQQGMRLDEYIRMTGMDPTTFTNMIRPQAKAQVNSDILMKAIIKAEDIQIDEEELNKSVEQLAEAYQITVEQLTNAIPRESMIDDMKKRKASELVIGSAIAVAPVAPVAPEAPAAPVDVEEKPKKKAPAKKAPAKKVADSETTEEKPKKAPVKKAAPKAE